MAYARVSVTRDSSGFTVSGQSVTLTAQADFAQMTGGAGGTVTHFALGTDATGAGHLLFFGAVSGALASTPVIAGVTPHLDTGTSITEASSDGMSNEAATNFLNHFFNNADWANIGDAGGLQNSTTAGVFYLSLHTASPGESGDQSTNEISYT